MDIKYYRKMKSIERLSGTFKHRPYNILEHQYMVAILFRHFASKEDVAYDMQVFDFILHHDALEAETGDLITTVKKFNKTTEECWDRIEEEVLEKHPQLRRYSDSGIRSTLTKQQFLLFKTCDYLDLWIFLKEEVAIGNRSFNVIDILKRCEELIPKDFKTINKFMAEYEY